MADGHKMQRIAWENEHKNPEVLPQISGLDASSGVKKFYCWIKEFETKKHLYGIEMGCGKGRNVLWLAKNGIKMAGFDFSLNAISEAKKRASDANMENDAAFFVHDATKRWPFKSGKFDFGIDCFASTDIETPEGRAFARDEFKRVIKPGGFLLVYTLSADEEFHRKMIKANPGPEKNSFIHHTGKFEKVFDRKELIFFYKDFEWVLEERIRKKAEFFGKAYECRHFWIVLRNVKR